MVELKSMYPSVEDRLNFMKGLVRISRADSKITVEEETFFLSAANGLELPGDRILELQVALKDSSVPLPVALSTKKQALFLFKEALQLCHIDGEFTDTERAEVERLGAELSIAPSEIDAIEAWVLEGMDWTKRGNQLLQELEGV